MTDQFQTAVANFYNRAIGLPANTGPQTFTAETLEDFKEMGALILRCQSMLQSKGIAVSFGGVEGKMVSITHDAHTLRVTLLKPPKQTDVRDTSRNAYETTDFSTQEGKVAQIIMAKTGEDITRAEIAFILGIQESRVSARVNALLHKHGQGGFFSGGKEYRLVLTGKRLSFYPGASDKPNEAMRFEKCEPVPESGTQTSMF